MPVPGTRTPTMERIHIMPGDTTSAFLLRKDLDLLRALYRGSPGGYSVHIRAAVHTMCNQIRAKLRETGHGRELLHKLGQDQ